MNINFKVRKNNPYFWIQIALAIVVPIGAYFGIQAEQITTWSMVGYLTVRTVSNPYVLFTILVSVFNALIDPTTDGFTDSKTAMTYLKPKKD
ncbi:MULTISPECIES: phage holin [unclassified Mammaliicoccus]|uniref:phage holin n=1 Tax=unclassified Mammaliicoccus TaxID=2803851 RepID=UPI001EFBD593|nr:MULTISPECIES: phage holin [unclassified Mammaliicoccus]